MTIPDTTDLTARGCTSFKLGEMWSKEWGLVTR